MTAISPAAAALPFMRNASLPTPVKVADTFVSLLADPVETLQQSLFSFSELGMFGLHAAQLIVHSGAPYFGSATENTANRDVMSAPHFSQSEPAGAVSRPDIVTPEIPGVPGDGTEYGVSGVGHQSGADQNGGVARTPADAEAASQRKTALPPTDDVAARSLPLVDSIGLLAQMPEMEESGPEKGVALQRQMAFSGPSLDPVNVVVAVAAEGLIVTARSAGLPPDGDPRLHQTIESTAAEFGLDIGELRINGSVFGPTFSTPSGGKRDSRTR